MSLPIRDSLVLRSPDALLASLPYLLGFPPVESVVAVWIAARRVLLTQRLDLAGWPVDESAWRRAFWDHPAARSADEVIVVVATSGPAPAGLAEALRGIACERDVLLRDVLALRQGRWRSALCTDTECCPADGRPIDPGVEAEVAAEFTVLGAAPLADRAAVVASMSDIPEESARLEARLRHEAAEYEPGQALPDDARDDAIGLVYALLVGSRTHGDLSDGNGDGNGDGDGETIRALVALADIRVRDTVLWQLCQEDGERLQRAMVTLIRWLRVAPAVLTAPVATACAVVAWLLGDGVRASIGVDRALSADADYTLAQLVGQSLRAGMAPAVWRDAMASVSRDECRYGLAASTAGRR